MNKDKIMLLIAGFVATMIMGPLAIIIVNEERNNPRATAVAHIEENSQGIQELLEMAAQGDQGDQGDQRAKQALRQLPQQEISQSCSRTEYDAQAKKAIGRSGITCQVSLYGNASRVHADYFVFMKYPEYSLWDKLRNRMQYPILDAYLDTTSLTIISPNGAIRVASTQVSPDSGQNLDRNPPANIRLTQIRP